MSPYTVLLLYPQHVANEYGENYMAHVRALSRDDAVTQARLEMCLHSTAEFNPREIKTIAVFSGHLQEV